MNFVTIIWSVIASGSLLLAIMYGFVWLNDRKASAAAAFAFESLAIVLSVIIELGLMYAATPAEWGEWVRWAQVPILARTTGMLAFIWFYFETGRAWLLWTVFACRALIMIVGFVVDPNFNFSHIESIQQVPFFGEMVTAVDRAAPSPYQWLATLTNFLFLAFIADASISLWRRGTREARRRALVIGGACFLSWGTATLLSQLVIFGVLKLPLLLSLPDLIVLAAMAFEVSRDTLRASRLARELRESDAQLEFAASAGGIGLWIWDVDKQRIWATNAARDIFDVGFDAPLHVAQLREKVHADDLESMARALAEATASRDEHELQFRLRRADGSLRWILARGRCEANARGRVSLIRGILRDITEQVRTREENEELRSELTHVGRVSVVGALSASLAHELAQPLGAILLNTEAAQMLLRKPNPDLEEFMHILDDIHRDDQRAAEVIERLYALLKRRQLEFAAVSVDSLVQDLAVLLKSDAVKRNVKLECASDPGLPAIRGDRVHLSQVLINLVINGMDAVSDMPVSLRSVTLRAIAAGRDSVEFVVTDSGTGIPAEIMGRIFQPFFTTKSSGMGMGLVISKTIVEAHQGRLWAESSQAAGATFRVSIPVFDET